MENSAIVMSEIEMSLVAEMWTKTPSTDRIQISGANRHTMNCENTGITHLVHIELALPSS